MWRRAQRQVSGAERDGCSIPNLWTCLSNGRAHLLLQVCADRQLYMVWFDLVLSCAKKSSYSCRCVQTDSFNHGLVWFCPVLKSPLTPAGVCRQTDLIMVWLVLSCAEGPTNTCRCVCTRPVYPYGFAVIPTDSDLKFCCYTGWVKNYSHCPIFPFPHFKLE